MSGEQAAAAGNIVGNGRPTDKWGKETMRQAPIESDLTRSSMMQKHRSWAVATLHPEAYTGF